MTTPPSAADQPRAHRDSVTASVDVAAPPERVFEALTDPAELAAWCGADADLREGRWTVDPRPGGRWVAHTRDPDGAGSSVGGEFRVVDAPHRLELTWAASWDDFAPTVVRFDLAPARVGGVSGTRVTVTHTTPAALDVRGQAGRSPSLVRRRALARLAGCGARPLSRAA